MPHSFGAENWDAERFGPYQPSTTGQKSLSPQSALKRIKHLRLGHTYELLADAHSKETLVKVWAYRLLGPEKVRLPLATPSYWARRKALETLMDGTQSIDADFLGMVMQRMNLGELGFPLELYLNGLGTMCTFVLKQYEYRRPPVSIAADEGDFVIDGGGGFGDTALFFANAVGAGGRVFSFEFVPSNLELHERNLDLNPELRARTEIVRRALWEISGESIGYATYGLGTSLLQPQPRAEAHAISVSIDDFVDQERLQRVDLVKMDIEGAELRALKGAQRTLRRFRPKLAISTYHRDSDFVDLPEYIDSLGLGYRFYLDHFTIYGEETILFARAA